METFVRAKGGREELTGRPLLVLKPWPNRLSFQFSRMSIPPYTFPTVNFPGPVSSGGGTRRSTIGGVPEKKNFDLPIHTISWGFPLFSSPCIFRQFPFKAAGERHVCAAQENTLLYPVSKSTNPALSSGALCRHVCSSPREPLRNYTAHCNKPQLSKFHPRFVKISPKGATHCKQEANCPNFSQPSILLHATASVS